MRIKHHALLADIGLLVISVLVVFLILEGFTRLIYPPAKIAVDINVYGAAPLPDGPQNKYYLLDDSLQRTEIGVKDLYGHLGDDIIYHALDKNCPDEEVFTVVLLGDSVTIGGGLNASTEGHLAFGNELQRLVSNYTGDESIKIVVLAQGGYNIVQLERSLREYMLHCDPDIVFYDFFQNDLNSNYIIRGDDGNFYMAYELIGHTPMFSGRLGDLLRGSVFMSRLDLLVYKRMMIGEVTSKANEPIEEKMSREMSPALIRFPRQEKALSNMVRASEEEGAIFILANFPYIMDGYPTTDQVYHFRDRFHVPLLDMRDEFMERNLTPPMMETHLVAGDVAHYGRYGHKKVAEILFDYLVDEGYICKDMDACGVIE